MFHMEEEHSALPPARNNTSGPRWISGRSARRPIDANKLILAHLLTDHIDEEICENISMNIGYVALIHCCI